MNLAVELKEIRKTFGSVVALDSVSLQVRAGSMHAVVGENGAGKTTLMRILHRSLSADSGETIVQNEASIGMVSQHYAIIPDLTCLQNLMLGAEGGAVINLRQAEERATTLAHGMGFSFDWSATADTLSPGAAQKLEILKLLWRNSQIMILDEPTAMLSPADSTSLFDSLKVLQAQGATIILITHRLPEVMDYCEGVTVLRGGRMVASMPVSETTPAQLAELIVGEALAPVHGLEAPNLGKESLSLTDLIVKGDKGQISVREANLAVRAGEMIGIAGVDGSGQRELVQAIVATRKVESGGIEVLGLAARSTTRERLDKGLRLIAEDRLNEAVLEGWSLVENSALGNHRNAPFARGPLVNVAERKTAAQRIAERFRTKHGGLMNPISSLSGGNQQRFVAGRALDGSPGLIVAFQPARGLDLKSTAEVYAGIRQACRDGAAALVVSFDLDELLEYCDRVVVMCNGTLTEPPSKLARDRETIGRLMVNA